MKKFMILSLLSMVLLSCEKEGTSDALYINTTVVVKVQDSKGADMLDPNHPNAIQTDKVRILLERDGVLIPFYDIMYGDRPSLEPTCPNGTMLRAPHTKFNQDCYTMDLNVYSSTENHNNPEMADAVIDWGNGRRDKITSQVRYSASSNEAGHMIEKAWLNDELVLDDARNWSLFTIVME